MMSVHDALEAWQDGRITASKAMLLSGAKDVLELYELAAACDLEIRLELTAEEATMVSKVTDAIHKAMEPSRGAPQGSPGIRAA